MGYTKYCMGKKKTAEKEPEATEESFRFSDILHSDAKRSIAAVLLFAFSLILILGYVDAAGKLGTLLDNGMGMMFGYGKWPFPLLLMVAGVMFLTRRRTTLADAVKYIGLLIAFISVLGLTHLLSGDTENDLLRLAKAGQGGGFIGYGFSSLLLGLTSRLAGGVILMMLFSIGVIAAFNVSLMRWFELLRSRLTIPKKEVSEEDDVREENTLEEQVYLSDMTQADGDGLDPDQPREGKNQEKRIDEIPQEVILPSEESLTDGNIESLRFHDDERRKLEAGEAVLNEEESDEEDDLLTDHDAEDIIPESPAKRRRRRPRANWVKPSTELLESKSGEAVGGDTDRSKHVIMSTLKHFGIDVEPGEVTVGPTVTRYTFRPGAGVKLSRITGLSNNLALALAAESVRIEAPIPGQSYIGIEIPNKSKAMVRMREIIENREFREAKLPLLLGIGQDVTGKSVFADLGEMPHLLIAGRTKSGKSVCVNAILTSLLYKNSPDDVKLILVDPKRVELSMYKGIPHLKADVVVDGKKVVNALQWAISEMERRYKLLEAVHVRDLPAYHELCRDGYQKAEIDERTGSVREVDLESLPFIVIVIDELAEIMVAYGKEVEPKIVRLAQMSRAVGIHLILATQRPSVEVITGLIKTNLPTRIAFQVSSQVDSRTILDTGGAEKLLGNGDMLYVAPNGETKRLQGVYVSTDEVRRVTNHWRKEKEAWGDEDSLEDDITAGTSTGNNGSSHTDGEKDELFDQAKDLFIRSQKASTTSLQTAFGIGYPRAARLMHILEEEGVVGMVDGKKQILIGRDMVAAPDATETPQYGDDVLRDQAAREKWQA
jgi:S-DNA-T family DNA segregation ATPase FtsK/SpoIIIE